jgi:hypothetical protein
MAKEKATYNLNGVAVDEVPAYDPKDVADIVASKGNNIGEAADIYGDIQTAEEYGYVSRGYASILDEIIGRMLLTITQPQITPHSVHCPRRYHWHRSLLGNWNGIC